MRPRGVLLLILASILLVGGCKKRPRRRRSACPLHKAARTGDAGEVDRLLRRGVDPDTRGPSGDTPMHEAAGRGHVPIVQMLVAWGAAVDLPDDRGCTPLFEAVTSGEASVARFLIEKGASLDARAQWNYESRGTLMHAAAGRGHETIVQLLIDRGIQINAKDDKGRTAIALATNRGHRDIVEVLAKAGAEVTVPAAAYLGDIERVKRAIERGHDVNARGPHWYTPLFTAVEHNDRQMAIVLLDHGAHIDAKGGYVATPLCVAAEHGYREMARLLLERGADVDGNLPEESGRMDDWRRGPLHWAASNGDKGMVELLLAHGADINAEAPYGDTPLGEALDAGHEEIVNLLLDRGATDKNGMLLHSACSQGNLSLVRRLIARDTNIQGRGWRDDTPLHAAVRHGYSDIAELLIQVGADLEAGEEYGRTPLQVAAQKYLKCAPPAGATHASPSLRNDDADEPDQEYYEDLMRLLIRHGANVDVHDDAGGTLLHLAIREGSDDLTLFLIAQGADVNARNRYGLGPLHYAASKNNMPVAKRLLTAGADVNIQDNDGDTPLHIAALRGHADMVRRLLAQGADVNLRDVQGNTPIDEALRRGHQSIVELLRRHVGGGVGP